MAVSANAAQSPGQLRVLRGWNEFINTCTTGKAAVAVVFAGIVIGK
jgi:hypothetical protein